MLIVILTTVSRMLYEAARDIKYICFSTQITILCSISAAVLLYFQKLLRDRIRL